MKVKKEGENVGLLSGILNMDLGEVMVREEKEEGKFII